MSDHDSLNNILSEQDKKNLDYDTKKVNPNKVKKPNLSSRMNKKNIIMTIGGAVFLLLIISQFVFSSESQVHSGDDEAHPNTRLPDFSHVRDSFVIQDSRAAIDVLPDNSLIIDDEKINAIIKNPAPVPRPASSVPRTPGDAAPVSQRISDEEWAARRAPLVYSRNSKSDNISAPDASSSTRAPFVDYSQLPQFGHLPDAQGSGINRYREQNMQDDKIDFFSDNRSSSYSINFADDTTLFTGTIISAVLRTGINTDLPGMLTAEVDRNVYDSLTGKNLLLPQGTKLIARYNSNISYAQKRLQIAWTKIIRPDGVIIVLGNMPGTDNQGYSGVRGRVNNHTFQHLKALGLISLMSIIQFEYLTFLDHSSNPALNTITAANMEAVNTWGSEIIDRAMDIQPTITVKPGTRVNVLVTSEMRLPPLPQPPVSERFQLR